jgi:flagellar hook-associated protein 2
MLKGSSELSNMLIQLRNAVIEPISDVGLNLSQIGIASTGYSDKGKLTIDETKLKSALDNNFDEVVNLFSKKSAVAYTDTANKATRYSENGIASRFDDILKDYTRTSRDTNGNKGVLIMKAGIENDTSAFSNEFSKRITGFDDRISSLLDDLDSKEAYYYNMFAKMESALSQMESQASSLMSQLGG